MNKKGFTLVELLAAVAIVSILTGIAVIAYNAILENAKMTSFKAYEKTMHAQAMRLMVLSLSEPDKARFFPSNGETKTLSLTDLEIDPFNNPKNKNDLCTDSYVKVKRTVIGNVDSFTYTVCLICRQSEYNASASEDLCEVYEN